MFGIRPGYVIGGRATVRSPNSDLPRGYDSRLTPRKRRAGQQARGQLSASSVIQSGARNAAIWEVASQAAAAWQVQLS